MGTPSAGNTGRLDRRSKKLNISIFPLEVTQQQLSHSPAPRAEGAENTPFTWYTRNPLTCEPYSALLTD